MVSNKAIVTIALGKRFSRMVDKICRKNWELYAAKYGYDLIIIDESLDNSEIGRSRCAAWQKCLILSQEWSKKYERIVWFDTDIIINPNAPDISEGIPEDKIGAVNEFASPTRELYKLALSRMYEHWTNLNYEPVINYGAKEYYKSFGIECDFEDVVQTGVMVFNPKIHKEILETVYYNYEEKGLNYEMRPLSYEILKSGLIHWIDYRFNNLLQFQKALYYPFLLELKGEKLPLFGQNKVKKLCIDAVFANSYFLHFTGKTEEMNLLDWKKFV
jgi:hypothetical protein